MRKVKYVWNSSQTKAWSYIQAISGAGVLALGQLHTYIADPTIKGYLGQLDLPKEVSIGLVVLGLITYIAHGHKED